MSFACSRADFWRFWQAFVDLGALGLQGGGRRRTQTPNDTKKAAPGSERGSLWGHFWKLAASFSAVFFYMLLWCPFFNMWCILVDFWRCFGRYLGSPGLLKIMPKCTTICIFMFWTLLVRSLFRDLLLEGVWDAFFIREGAVSLIYYGGPV